MGTEGHCDPSGVQGSHWMRDATHKQSTGPPGLHVACNPHLQMAVTGPRALSKAVCPEITAQLPQRPSEKGWVLMAHLSLVEGS